MLSPAQLRAARALVGWSRETLAERSGVGAPTIRDFELSGSDPRLGTVNKWRRALEIAGIEFIEEDDIKGPGVRLSKSSQKQEGKRRKMTTMLDTTPITTEITRLISIGTTEQALLVAVVQLFPNLSSAELSQALQVATAAAEKRIVRARH
jgi:transcriptional regulator with XRE-family HTH domain